MAYFVKVIPPSKRARIHAGDCTFCRDGQGMENQDKGTGPTYWKPAHPEPGFPTVAEAVAFMAALPARYTDTGYCDDCQKRGALNA